MPKVSRRLGVERPAQQAKLEVVEEEGVADGDPAVVVLVLLAGIGVTQGERTLWSSAHALEVLAFNEWPGLTTLPEIISAFVCPNHPSLSGLLHAVSSRMQEWTGDGALNGYQSGSTDRCYKMLAAVYHALSDLKIAYINPPASFEQDGQKVRSPDQVIGGGRCGTCLDLTVVAVAMLEQMGLHPPRGRPPRPGPARHGIDD
ncbi:MAG TPA: hypothetical protein VF624_18325 [Tepidisphaeraceae bacterium]|jgi:hypothetical protein